MLAGQLRPASVTMMNLVANVLNKLLIAGVTDEGKFFINKSYITVFYRFDVFVR